MNDPVRPVISALTGAALTGAALAERCAQIRAQIGHAFVGQGDVLDQLLIALLAGGHVLIEGAPGLGKTLLVRALAAALDCSYARVQFTPDLMPSDVSGHAFYDPKSESFRIRRGPVFANLLLADEINRAPAKTQAALLEAMQELQVTIESRSFALEPPFVAIATQNPIEQEGTYPLPEAQLDRFLLQVDVDYPELAAERQILLETTGVHEAQASAAISAARLMEIQNLIRQMPVSEKVLDAILSLVRSARPGNGIASTDKRVAWGPGPRAGQAMMLCARARALYEGRLAPSVDDVLALAEPVLQHRMALTFGARAEGMSVRDVIAGLVRQAGG